MIKYLKEHKTETILVLAITIFALILRIIALQNFGDLWVDELYSKYFASKNSAIDITKALFKEDFHVPFYFVLLHYWAKLFGSADNVLRLMGLLITTLTIPVSYYVVKDLFNDFAGAFSAVLLAINAFNIHYSVELRFYGIAILFALLSTYFFVKLSQNFNKKWVICYSIFTLLLLYTYNFSFMYVFCQFIVGLIYFIKTKKNCSKYIGMYSLIGVLYLPVIVMILHNILTYQTSILQFVRDIFAFDLSCLFTLLMTIYTNCFEQFTTNDIMRNYYYFKYLFSFEGILYVVIPISIGIYGFISALKSKNNNIKIFIYPAILLLIIQIVLVFCHTLAFVLRYTIISTTLILITSIIGLTLQIKPQNKKNEFVIAICSLWLILNLIFLFHAGKYSVLSRNIVYSKNLTQVVENLNIKPDDYVFIPRFDKLVRFYIPQGNHIDIDTYDSLFLGNRPQDIEFIFGRELSAKLDRKMAKTYLYDYLVNDESLIYLHKNLKEKYFSKMHKGQRFIIVTDEALDTLKTNQEWFKKDINVYARSAIYYTLSAKILNDIIEFSKQDLKYKQHLQPSEMFDIYVFEKE